MPIDPKVIPAVTALARVLGADNRDFVLIGATVPQILLRVQQGGEASARTTRDVDALVAAGNWEDFERTRRRLFEVGFGPGAVRHELLFGQDVIIDLIPYGEQLVQNDRLEWPGTDQVMSTLGVEEAFASAKLEELVPGLSVRVVPIPGLVLLKIVAYQDRPEERARDLSDVVYCFEYYEEDIVQSRRFDLVGVDVIGEPVEFEEAGAYLLGTEVARLASPKSLLAARRLIDMIPDEYSRPISQILREERRMINNEGRRMELFRLFRVFAAGLSGGARTL